MIYNNDNNKNLTLSINHLLKDQVLHFKNVYYACRCYYFNFFYNRLIFSGY